MIILTDRVNLNTTAILQAPKDAPTHALPVSVDLNWLKAIQADPSAGIVHRGSIIAPNMLAL